MKRLWLTMMMVLGLQAGASTNWTEEAEISFGRIPILYDGRVMPMNQFARLHLLQFRGKTRISGQGATQWLARVLFAPRTTGDEPLFMVNHPEVLDALHVERTQVFEGEKKPSSRFFSIKHLAAGFEHLETQARRAAEMEADERGPVDKEFLRLASAVRAYLDLTKVFEFTRPHPEFRITEPELRKLLEVPSDAKMLSYVELKGKAPVLLTQIKPMNGEADPDMSDLTPAQREAFRLTMRMFGMAKDGENVQFLMLPRAPHGDVNWVTPMQALHEDERDVALMTAVDNVASMASAFVLGDTDRFVEKADAVEFFSADRMKKLREVRTVRTEEAFHRLAPFSQAKVWYIIALVLSMLCLFVTWRPLHWMTWVPLGVGLVYHTIGIVWRVVITARPPVTNLYGTFIFVALVCVLLAIICELWMKNGIGLFVGALIAVSFLLVADRFAVEGDTMQKVVAVLASNFWLSTHVICITIGYAFCWLAGVLGHVWLVQEAAAASDEGKTAVMKCLEGVLGFGLAFAFLGTMLGGVWADQSWGRFWGWDPKENGALLIVLWTAAMYHARIAGLIRDRGMAICALLGCIVVVAAWLGVNLLGVGLHNYGFTSTLFYGFFGYIGLELLFLVVVLVWIYLAKPQA